MEQTEFLYKGRVFDLVKERVQLPNGKASEYEIIHHRGAVVLLPSLGGNQYLLIHQYRPSLHRTLWEFPAGTLEAGENTRRAAARELKEETGYRAGSLKKVLEFYSSPGLTTEKMYLFLAKGLRIHGGHARPILDLDEDEILVPKVFSLRQLEKMVQQGDIIDAKTIIGVWYLQSTRRKVKPIRRRATQK